MKMMITSFDDKLKNPQSITMADIIESRIRIKAGPIF